MLKENEKNACDSFVYILRKIGLKYKVGEIVENSRTKDVEMILSPEDESKQYPKIAIEHTIIEAHNNQKLYVQQLSDIENEISQKCQGKLPADRLFSLIVPPILIIGKKRKKRSQFIEKMTNWIPTVAGNLEVDAQSIQLYKGHKIALWCFSRNIDRLDKNIFMRPTRPENGEEEIRSRFRRAVTEKIPKLIKYKEKSYDTALLFEDVSFSYCSPNRSWIDLIPDEYRPQIKLIDFIVTFVSVKNRMSIGFVWKEKSQLYSRISEIPDDRKILCSRLLL